MFGKTGFQITCTANITLFRVGDAAQNVCVEHVFLLFCVVQPSVALRAMEGILCTLRFTPLIFAGAKKNLRIANLTACHP